MSSETDKDKKINSQIDEEEEAVAPTTGLNSNVVATGKPQICITVKCSMLRNFYVELASNVNAFNNVLKMEDEEDYNEQRSSDMACAEAPNSLEEARAVSGEGELKKKTNEECGSSESKRISDNETPSETHTCPECLKTFPSCKSLYGHLRSHPNRGYRGANKPALTRGLKRQADSSPPHQTLPVSGWGVRAKRGRTAEQEAAIEAAETLVMISQGHPMSPRPIEVEEGYHQERFCVTEEEDIKGESLPHRIKVRKGGSAVKTYQCSTCNKTFTTHQALGGHTASHNKHRNNTDAEAMKGAAENVGAAHARDGAADPNGAVARTPAVEHRCKICNETFATGQALGGHMRRHYNGPLIAASPEEDVQDENPAAAQEDVQNENHAQGNAGNGNRGEVRFDLNEAPPQSEEEEERAAV